MDEATQRTRTELTRLDATQRRSAYVIALCCVAAIGGFLFGFDRDDWEAYESSPWGGYLVGGTSPFGTRKAMPVYIEDSILALPRILINGGRRGYLVGIDPQVCVRVLGATPVHCALDE